MEVDRAGLTAIADALTTSGAEVGDLATGLGETGFGPESAGSRYESAGRNLDAGLRGIAEWLGAWRQAIDATAASTGSGSVAYTTVDEAMVESLRAAGRTS